MNFVDYLCAKTATPSDQCIYGLPLGTCLPPGRPEWLGVWSAAVENELVQLQRKRSPIESVEAMAEKIEKQPLGFAPKVRPLLNHARLIEFPRKPWSYGDMTLSTDRAAVSAWAFFEVLRAFENGLKINAEDAAFAWRAQFRLMVVSDLKQKFFTQAMIGYESCMHLALCRAARVGISDARPPSLPPMAHYLIEAMTWCSKGKEKQLAVKCLPGLSKANEWLARTALPVERTTSHFGPIHHAAIRGGAAEMALEGLNLNTTQMAALFGALPQGETFMEPMNIYTRLAALEKRHAERKRSGGARFMASQNIPLSAQWRNGDGDSGEIAISRIPNVALPDSLAKLRAYLCFYRGNEDARLIPLDLAYEDWQDEGGTLVFDYAVEETKISAAFDDNTAHIDADEVTMTEDSETGETIIRIEAHSLI